MTPTIDRAATSRFRGLVARKLGLGFDDGRLDALADVLRNRLESEGTATDAYLERLGGSPEWREEWRVLAERLTVSETYFFRYADHFRALSELVLPALLRSGRSDRRLRILSAGCASGEEAYSLAILLREIAPSVDVEILGADVNPVMVRKATRAVYGAWALRETPADLKGRHFRPEGRDFALNDSVRSMVRFEERNLLEPDPVFWAPEAFDLVLCRNVTMYFPSEASQAVIARIAVSLAPGGHLFLGHAETLRGISDEFQLQHTHDTFYYRRRGPIDSAKPAAAERPMRFRTTPPAVLDPGTTWFEAIRRASDRIAVLAETPPRGGAPTSHPRRGPDLSGVRDLFRQERFADAMEALAAMPADARSDPDAVLLRAALQTNAGDLAGAKDACRLILELDDLNAGARYLLALCLEQEGDRLGAAEQDQAAVYLDAKFAMPRLHLGLLAKRRGDLEAARAELSEALDLLVREEASRILLFGGGFSREALMELCRRELHSCGGGR